jgi:hypothetical protein
MPSEFAKIFEISNSKNLIRVQEVNQSFSMKNNNKRTIVKVFDYKKILKSILKTKLDHCSKLKIVNITNTSIKAAIKLNNSCDIDIKFFNKSFEINQSKNTFSDIP